MSSYNNAPLSLKANIIIVAALQAWLFVDQIFLNYVNKIASNMYDGRPYTLYKAISLFLIAMAIAFYSARGRVPVILAIAFIVINICVCTLNLPFLSFVNNYELFVVQNGFLCFKLIQRLCEIKQEKQSH